VWNKKCLFLQTQLILKKRIFLISGIKKLGFCFLMTLCFYSATYGQHLHFSHITTEDGLSQNSVNCIYQDRTGFMWFGTQDGLNRYDGYNIITFRHDPADSNSISHSWIWDVYEDKEQNLWIATWHGLNKYNPHTNKFTIFLPDSTDSCAISGDRPAAICEDGQGNIWVGTWGGGLNKYINGQHRFVHYLYEPGNEYSLPNNFVRALFTDKSGRIWVGTWNGLAMILDDEDSTHFQNYLTGDKTLKSKGARIMSIDEDTQGNIYAGAFGSGLYYINPSNGIIRQYQHESDNINSIASDDIASVQVDKNGIVWVGTISNGLNSLNPHSGQIKLFNTNTGESDEIGGNEVYSISEDLSGLLWIGAGGINILNPQNERFSVIKINKRHFKDVDAFCEDDKGNIWFASNQNGLMRYAPSGHQMVIFKHNLAEPFSLSCNSVSDIIHDKSGNIWIGTRRGGLNLYQPGTQTFRHFPEKKADKTAIVTLKYINSLAANDKGQIWIGTYDRGLVRFDPIRQSYTYYQSDAWDPETLSGNNILHLFMDSRQQLWIGIWGGGLCSFNRKEGSFKRYMHDPKDPNSLSDNIVHVIHEVVSDSGRVLWLGTSNGLSYFMPDREKPVFHHFTTKNGLFSNVIYGIIDDNHGNLWLSSNSGLTKFNPVSGRSNHFNSGDGLQSNEFNSSACYRLKNGIFLFGGINGYNSFYPDSISESSYKPTLALTSFRVLNEEKYTSLQLSVINDIVLSYKENFFSFDFSALDFTEPSKNKYKYQLSGIDHGWIDAQSRHFANYTDIKPGNYTFRVRGTNSDGILSNKIRQLRIRIRPPYWQTWWFYVLMIVLVMTLLYGIHRYRVRKILELERLRIRIASDLHDDIGSALTRIAIHSEQLQSGKNPGKVPGISKKIGTLSRSVISMMSDIVWSIDAHNDTWGNMLDRMKDEVYNTLLVKEVNTTFNIKGIDESHKIPLKYRQNIFYIFKEAINNIMKHSNANNVKIAMHKSPHIFEMEVADDGYGFDFEHVRYGNGLRNMKMRAENIGGILDILTETGVTVKLKVKGI